MKKTFISVILIALLCLSACSNNNTLTKQEQNILPSSKDSVDEFIILLKQMQSTGSFNEYIFDEKFCYNVTTDNILYHTNAKIFKFSDSYASFIMIDENIYELCQSFGGYGFINAVPCDFDNDNNKDLLISSSWGSGIHHAVISIFNTKTKQSTILYDTSKSEKTNADLIIRESVKVIPNVPSDESPSRYEVCAAELNVTNNDSVNISYNITEIIGFIKGENNAPIFSPDF